MITIGETMAMVTPEGAEPLVSAARFRVESGGAESNLAVHLASLGRRVVWASRLGADPLGERVLAAISARGVDTRFVERDPLARTGLYVKDPGRGVSYYRDGSAASLMDPRALDPLPLARAAIVHLSGITPALSAGCAALVDACIDRVRALCAPRPLLSFDVNHRPALWPEGAAPEALRALAARCDLVFVGLDEAERLWGTASAEEVRAFLPEPGVLVVKDADIGATEFRRSATAPADERVFVPATPTRVVEAVGAGDAFAAGYLHALLGGVSGAAERLAAGHARAVRALSSTRDVPEADPAADPKGSPA